MNTTKKVMFASASGAMIGYAVASQLLHGWLFVGAIIGAIAGWFLYDPVQFFASVKEAFVWVVEEVGTSFRSTVEENWKGIFTETMRDIRSIFISAQIAGTAFSYVAAFAAFNVWLYDDTSSFGGYSIGTITIIASLIGYGVPLIVAMTLSSLQIVSLLEKDNRNRADVMNQMHLNCTCKRCRDRKSEVRLVFRINPVIFPLFAVYFVARKIIWLASKVPMIIRCIWLVTVMTFHLAHSNGRLASAIGGALGAFVGLWAGHLIVAMLVGAIAGGIAHYLGQFCSAEYVEELKANLTGKKVKA